MIARVRTDIALAEFETGIRDLVSNVENAYWDLYFAYHDLEAKKRARDQALSLWNLVNADLGRSETQDRLLQAQEQYWRFQADVYDSLDGRLIDGTRTNNGSSGGTFRAVGGLRVAERRLRLAMGVPITDGRLIKPATEPTEAPVAYEWRTCAAEALAMRPELRTQRWRVKQRELELIANRNFTAPRLDLAGRYRWRGFGESLVSQSNAQFASAWGNLADGDNQEWQLGVELEMPLGFRQGYNAVRNAELALTRERALLQEQSQTVMFGLSNAFGEVRRAYRVLQTQYNRRDSAQQAAVAISQAREAGRQNLDVVLESQRRLLESELLYRQAQIDYMLAIKAVHFEKGTLLDYYSVTLQEGRAPALAYRDAALRDANRVDAIDYVRRTPVVSTGPVAAAGAPHVQHEAIISDSGSADSRMAAPLPTPAARP
ncbi:MAG TPA: TolC family protein [Lacipirellulaceae bacterium]|nr:TolC family protein [Lacipirellulaceae bacterium]